MRLVVFRDCFVEALLRDASEVKRGTSNQFLYEKHALNARIALGERVVRCLNTLYGKTKADDIMAGVAQRANGFQPRPGDDDSDPMATSKNHCIPYGFWRKFIEEELHSPNSRRKQAQLRRSLTFYVSRIQAGACTPAVMRGMRKPGSCRGDGSSPNSRKAAGLDFALLQYFVDYVQRLSCRADSCMLMKKARELRLFLKFKTTSPRAVCRTSMVILAINGSCDGEVGTASV